MYRVSIEMPTEKAAKEVKRIIEELHPMLDGMVTITKEPEITTLNKIIEWKPADGLHLPQDQHVCPECKKDWLAEYDDDETIECPYCKYVIREAIK